MASVGFCKIQHLFGKRHKRNDSCVAWSSLGILNSGCRAYHYALTGFWGPYSSYLAELPSLNTKGGVEFYCNLMCHMFLMFMGDLSLSEQKKRGEDWVWAEGKWRKGMGGEKRGKTVVGM